MSTYQHRITLKGPEDRISYFTKLVRDLKIAYGLNSAEILLEAISKWRSSPCEIFPLQSFHHYNRGNSRIFYLQVLATPYYVNQLNTELESFRHRLARKFFIQSQNLGRLEFLLEGLILILENYKSDSQTTVKESNFLSNHLINNQLIDAETGSSSPYQYKSSNDDHFRFLQRCARCYSVETDQGIKSHKILSKTPEPEKNHHLISWRQRLREQQLAENRKLNEMVRSHSSLPRFASEERSLGSSKEVQNGHEGCVLGCKHTSHLDNKTYVWKPVHDSAIVAANTGMARGHMTPKRENTNFTKLGTTDKYDFNNNLMKLPRKEERSSHTRPNLRKSQIRQKFGKILQSNDEPMMTFKERNLQCFELLKYLETSTPDIRQVPGFDAPLSNFERIQHGIDCDEVFPGIFIGTGGTVRRKDYLKRLETSHILNAAESRGVNVDRTFFAGEFDYHGLRIEDTPQTQICRYFLDVVEFIDEALINGGKVFVNCVFGKSRSATCVVAYLMLVQGWGALQALQHLKKRRSIRLNYGFLQQLADLDHKLQWHRQNNLSRV